MTCREVADTLIAYLDGSMSPDERGALEHHLSLCRVCVDYLSTYQSTVELVKSLRDEPESIPEDLVKAIRAALPSRN